MKLAYIATSDAGGAGHAALRLHEGMLRRGLSCDLLLRDKTSNAPRLHAVSTRADMDEHLALGRDAAIWQYLNRNRVSLSNSHFSLHVDGVDLSDHPIVSSSDIVHLHWISALQTPQDVEALLRTKPVVWTLHDAEPLTGGCHYPSGCDGYTKTCDACPQLAVAGYQPTKEMLAEKLARWSGHPLTFIVPSLYMAERVHRSAIGALEGIEVAHIPHGVDVQTFRPRSKVDARRRLGVPSDGLYVLAGSLNTAEYRKGLHRISDIATAIRRRVPQEIKLRFLIAGAPEFDAQTFSGVDVIQLGQIPIERMPRFFAAGDLFLHTSYEDNSPLMLLEALACGTPAIAFSSGGAAELIVENECGHVIELGAENAFVEAAGAILADSHKRQTMSHSARKRVEEQFSDDLSLQRHLELYETTFARPRRSRSARYRSHAIPSNVSSSINAAVMAQMNDFEKRIADLEGLLQTQLRQVQEKQAEVEKVHDIAKEREELIDSVTAARAQDARSNSETIEKQRREIELVQGVAEERLRLIRLVEAVAAERKDLLQTLQAQLVQETESSQKVIAEQRREIELVHEVAAERLAVIQRIEEQAVKRQHDIDALWAHRIAEGRAYARTIEEQRREIDLVHEVAAERLRVIGLIEELAGKQQREIEAQRREIELVHEAAAERLRVIEVLNREIERLGRTVGDLRAMLEEGQGFAGDRSFYLPPLTRLLPPNSQP